jgi:hypothetical protein
LHKSHVTDSCEYALLQANDVPIQLLRTRESTIHRNPLSLFFPRWHTMSRSLGVFIPHMHVVSSTRSRSPRHLSLTLLMHTTENTCHHSSPCSTLMRGTEKKNSHHTNRILFSSSPSVGGKGGKKEGWKGVEGEKRKKRVRKNKKILSCCRAWRGKKLVR